MDPNQLVPTTAPPLRFHWMLPKGGEIGIEGVRQTLAFRRTLTEVGSRSALPDMPAWCQFATLAEDLGIDSLLVSFGRYEPDSLMVACSLAMATSRLNLIAAYRSGLIQPAAFVQQVNTVSALCQGRIAINVVAGSSSAEQRAYGDYLEHDQRYHRSGEFIDVCRAFWQQAEPVNYDGQHYRIEKGRIQTPFVGGQGEGPEVYISGHSDVAYQLARSRNACYLRVVDSAEHLSATVQTARQAGIEVCLRFCLVCRPTREQAIAAALELLPNSEQQEPNQHATSLDSQMYREARLSQAQWRSRTVWLGLIPHYGPVWAALVGTPQEIAKTLIEYKSIGVTQFIISGCPELPALERFGREIMPRVRACEATEKGPSVPAGKATSSRGAC